MGQKVRDRQLAVLESCDRANAKIQRERLEAAAPSLLAALVDLQAQCQKWALTIDQSRARAAIAAATK